MINSDHGQFDLLVRSIRTEAKDIILIRLEDSKKRPLPKWFAGAHLQVNISNDIKRQYSLCNDPNNEFLYEIAVLKDPDSRGGSQALHKLTVGDTISVTGPRNNFSLAGTEAVHHLLIAGGIGVTPIIAMTRELEARSADFHLHFCARDRDAVPFANRFDQLSKQGKATVYLDGGDVSRGLKLTELLAAPIPAQHVYVCGPPSMMKVARESVGAWAPHTVHFERFSGDPTPMEEDKWEDVPFEVVANRSGRTIKVPAHCSIVSALRSQGVEISVSCEAGFCGACLTRVLRGDPVHRDTVLSKLEQKTHTLVCRARSRSPVLVLDV